MGKPKQPLLVVLFFCLAVLPDCEIGAGEESPYSLALVNGTLIDGLGGRPVPDATVVLRDGRIDAVGAGNNTTIPPESVILDLEGGTILPGIINAHVHIRNSLEELVDWAAAGVTTVRDMGGPENYEAAEANNKNARSARLVTAGPMVSVRGGYPSVPWGSPYIVAVESPEDAYQKTLRLLDRGADFIKIAVEHGAVFGMRIPSLTTAEVSSVVRAAHGRGKAVSVHLLSAVDLAQALESEVDDIAHMVVDELPDSLLKKMVERDVFWEPTLELWHNVGQDFGPRAIRNLGKFLRAGGRIALGTDYGGYNRPFELGMPLKEMLWMQAAGMANMEIIVAATKNAARACRLDSQTGTLEPGKCADILVVEGDPLTDIRTLAKPLLVIRAGVLIRQKE